MIIAGGLVPAGEGLGLHPELLERETSLNGYRSRWFLCADRNPLAWYAALTGTNSAALIAARISTLPADSRQIWVATPYHAQLVRDRVRVYPEGMLPWGESDARHLCDVLNPLLFEEGMTLIAAGAALLLACREPMDAWPFGFSAISGRSLPNEHHEGEDGGRLNRLLSEIQMLLFQQPDVARHDRGDPDINGLWLWSPCEWPGDEQLSTGPAVATRNPVLASIAEARDARIIISEPEQLAQLLDWDGAMPDRLLITGEGHAVWLERSFWSRFCKPRWQPKQPESETALMARLPGLVRA